MSPNTTPIQERAAAASPGRPSPPTTTVFAAAVIVMGPALGMAYSELLPYATPGFVAFGAGLSWGAVVWLTSVISLIAVEALFPQIYGGDLWVILIELSLLAIYLLLALLSAREHPP